MSSAKKKVKKPEIKHPPLKPFVFKGPQFKNKYGYFTEDGREFVITRPDTPRPWVNLVCNPTFGFVVSQNGMGFTWKDNSQLGRLNRWEQDLIKDDYGKFLYVRDNQTKKVWSITPKPCDTKLDSYEARYGLGYAIFRSSCEGIAHEMTQLVPKNETIEIWKVTLKNEKRTPRRLSLTNYFEWCLGAAGDTHREFHKTFIETRIDRKLNAIFGKKRPGLMPGSLSTSAKDSTPLQGFLAVGNARAAEFDGDKESFFGRYGTNALPQSVAEGKLKNREGKWNDAIAAVQTDITLKPGEEKTVLFLIGLFGEDEEAKKLIQKYSQVQAVDKALEDVKTFWKDVIEDCYVETPDNAINIMTNIWLKYQAIAGRLWSRTGYYQCSGAFGFRDQLQDSHVYLPLDAKLTKKQILLHAEQQYPDGTVRHWWHPNTTIFSHAPMTDNLLWLSFVSLNYLDETEDYSLFDIEIPYIADKENGQEKGTLYNHCVRAIERVFARWSHRGLPLIGEGDWNDGLSHVGTRWKGESIWLGQFLYTILQRFILLAEKRGDTERAQNYKKRAHDLKNAINEHAWDGEWYIGATRDDGRPLGSKTEKEGKIFLNTQTWAIISGVAPQDRAKKCMESAEKYLFREYGPLLLTPGYSQTDPTIGYITRYAPSVRENGGLYTHAGTWAIQAECMRGKGDLACKTYRSFSPPLRGLDPDHYYAEPYVTPGNVDGPDSPNFGRGGWSWYTGSAAWLFKVTLDWMLGVRSSLGGIVIDPCIPKKWPGFKVRRVFRDAVYNIEVINPKHVEKGVKEIIVDGVKISGNVIKTHRDHLEHTVKVVMG